MQGEQTTCLPCLKTILLAQKVALDQLQLADHLKLARDLQAHK
jgi:hypothetical protein